MDAVIKPLRGKPDKTEVPASEIEEAAVKPDQSRPSRTEAE